jgi:putative DNA primase/helicase
MIPEELLELRQWVVWRREDRDGKPTKVPYQPATPGARASTTDPATWADYATAAAVQAVDGIGFVFSASDPFAGIDIDHCIDAAGAIDPKTAAILRTLDSYSEISPSGTGVHCIIRATLNGGRRRAGNFENYDRARFFCVTGRHLPNTPTTIEARQAELEEVRAAVFPAEHKPQAPARSAAVNGADDRELLELASKAKNGADFDRLYRGSWDGYDSQSEADLALANRLAFWAGPDPGRVDRLFRASGLMREKWDTRHGDATYGEMTIARALEGRTDFYGTPSKRATAAVVAAGPGQQSATPATTTYALEYDAKGLKLPPTPELHDVAGQCAWLTAVFALDPAHPVTSGKRHGLLGPACHVELRRAGAAAIFFEPASRINRPMTLIETLSWAVLHTDGATPRFKGVHCQVIAHVIKMLCGRGEALTAEQEAAGIVSTFLAGAVETEVPVTTHGTGGQKYEAVIALRREIDQASGRPIGPFRYARDQDTGELVIAVDDLVDAARRHTGSSLPHGWVNARMASLGWERVTLEGRALPGRAGMQGPKARGDAYRGHLTTRGDAS